MRRWRNEYGAALTADFQRYYNLRFLTALYDTHSPQEILDLILGLPDDSRFATQYNGFPSGWGSDRFFAAYLLDTAAHHLHAFASVNSKKKLPEYKPIDIPGREKAKRKPAAGSFMAQASALLGNQG